MAFPSGLSHWLPVQLTGTPDYQALECLGLSLESPVETSGNLEIGSGKLVQPFRWGRPPSSPGCQDLGVPALSLPFF